MKVDKLALDRIFDRTEWLEAPLFQRPYVWQRGRNWEPLWNTIPWDESAIDKRTKNCFGAVKIWPRPSFS